MDEPMSSLDFSNQAMILKIISSLSDDGKTIVITSHNPNHALAISASVCIIDRKRNIICGKSNDLLRDPHIINSAFGDNVVYEESTSGGHLTFRM